MIIPNIKKKCLQSSERAIEEGVSGLCKKQNRYGLIMNFPEFISAENLFPGDV